MANWYEPGRPLRLRRRANDGELQRAHLRAVRDDVPFREALDDVTAETPPCGPRSPQDAPLPPGVRITPDGPRYSAAWL